MRKLRLATCLSVLIVAVVLVTACSVTNKEFNIADVPEAIKEQMKQDRDEGGAFVYRPEDHDIDGYYLMFSQGLGANPGPIGPVPQLDVVMDQYKYNSQTKTLTVTIHQYTYEHGKVPATPLRRPNVTSAHRWYIIMKFKGRPIDNFKLVTSEDLSIPVITK